MAAIDEEEAAPDNRLGVKKMLNRTIGYVRKL